MFTYYMYAGNNDFFVGFCLVLERKLLFLRWLLEPISKSHRMSNNCVFPSGLNYSLTNPQVSLSICGVPLPLEFE